jgi:hypothetical protein
MFFAKLFVGIPIQDSFAEQFSKSNPQLIDIFIKRNNPEYLQEVEQNGIVYLGKSIQTACDIVSLDLIQANILSLLKKIVPDYSYSDVRLVLFPIVETKE